MTSTERLARSTVVRSECGDATSGSDHVKQRNAGHHVNNIYV